MRTLTSFSPSLLLLSLTLVLAGCASAVPQSDGLRTTELARDASSDDLSIDTLFSPRAARYQIIRGDHNGETMTITTERDAERCTVTRSIDGGETLSELRVLLKNDRAIEQAFRNVERDVIVRLRPKQQLWPIEKAPQEMDIRIVKLDDPDSLKERGTATSTRTIEGFDRVTTPAGEFDAVRVRTVFESDLRAANARRETVSWYTPDRGLVAERWDERVTALGITVERSARTIVRLPD